MVSINSKFTRKVQSCLHHGPTKLQNAINKIHSMAIFIIQKQFHENWRKNSCNKKKFDYWLNFFNSVINEFQNGKDWGDKSFIIPPDLFRIAKPLILTEIAEGEPNNH